MLLGNSWSAASQDLQLQVRVQAPSVQLTDRSVFEEMEQVLQEFANTTKWSTREVDFVERLQGSLVFNVTEYNQASGNMTGTSSLAGPCTSRITRAICSSSWTPISR